MQIQFLYSDGCPYNGLARSALSEAILEEGMNISVEEIRVQTEEEARRVQFPGSPTIRINGRDIIRGGPPNLGCRSYLTEDGHLQGWPDKEIIRWALAAAQEPVGCCG
jgi:hypothetical protein